jgi:4-methyl-5(b-hydroxyethyl)-thiazole monophosphate biosynthesis
MKKIAFLIANQSEFMETIDPYDILARQDKIEPVLISMEETLELAMAPKGKIIADVLYKDINIEDFDALVLPGGLGHSVIDNHPDIDKILKHFFDNDKVVAAICAAPCILGKRGYLKGKKATS